MNIPENLPTRAISLWQPYGWLVANNHKGVENRPRNCLIRGHVLIHAAKHCVETEFRNIKFGVEARFPGLIVPDIKDMQFGGIIGVMTIYGCVTKTDSPWFTGPYGWLVKDCKPLPFRPCRGSQGFFHVDYYQLKEAV